MIKVIRSSLFAIFFIPMLLLFLHPGQAKAWPAAINIFTKYGGVNVTDIPVSYQSGKVEYNSMTFTNARTKISYTYNVGWHGKNPDAVGDSNFLNDIGAYPIVGGDNGVANGVRTCAKDLCEECRDGHRGDLPGNPPCKSDRPSWAWWPGTEAREFTCNPDIDPDEKAPGVQRCDVDPLDPACVNSGSQPAAFVHVIRDQCRGNADFDANTVDKLFWSLFKIPYRGDGYTVDPNTFPLTPTQRSCTGISSHLDDGGWTSLSGVMGYSFNCACTPIRITVDLQGVPYDVEKIEKSENKTMCWKNGRYGECRHDVSIPSTCNGPDHKCTVNIIEAPNGRITNVYFTLKPRALDPDPVCNSFKVMKDGSEVSSANPGDTTTLEWKTQNTRSAVYEAFKPGLYNPHDPVERNLFRYFYMPSLAYPYTPFLPNGSSPPSHKNEIGTYNFLFSVFNAEMVKRECFAALNVALPSPPVCDLTVSPNSVMVGDSVKIDWDYSAADYSNPRLKRNPGSLIPLTDLTRPISLIPTQETTYTLVVKKNDGTNDNYECDGETVKVKLKNSSSVRPVAP